MIAVLDYGIGNLRSAQKALEKAGADARLIADPADAIGATGVVLPGVGAFGRCMEALHQTGLDQVAVAAIAEGTPFLGICVGMQLLYEASDESPGVKGLGVLDGTIVGLSAHVKRPQMQWNILRLTRPESVLLDGLGTDPWVYFLHSFAAPDSPDVAATCEYGGRVVAAVERGSLWATQFHPEKSGMVGARLLTNFAKACA